MTHEEIKTVIGRTLRTIAPEIDLATIDPADDFRVQTDLDSMDFLNLVIGLHKTLGVEIPEADYPKLQTLNGLVSYLAAKLEERGSPAPL